MSRSETSDRTSTRADAKLATVLLVDDDAALIRGLERHLEEDFHVLTAICPAEANVVLSKERVDLILSDNLMTGELGTEFVEKVNNTYPHIKLLMLSGYMPDAAARRVVAQGGVDRVLTKPCPSQDVLAAIRNALGIRKDCTDAEFHP